jgi:hypothetical protein
VSDLFGGQQCQRVIVWPKPPGLPRRIQEMHGCYGTTEGKTCKTCKHLLVPSRDIAGRYYKCRKTKITNGAATDWRVRWPACGLFVERETRS